MLVYLFELDSVRNHENEIKLAQEAMYEEIARNGNQVVLSFNQLADSQAFLSLIGNDKTYNDILELFKLGALKISLYGETQTASQYVQKSINKNLEEGKDAFVFSALPVHSDDFELLEKIRDALKFSDLSIIENAKKEKGKAPELVEDLEYIYRYVKLILLISVEPLAINTRLVGECITLAQMIKKVLDALNCTKHRYEFSDLLPEAVKLTYALEKIVSEDSRSIRVKKLLELEHENLSAVFLAEAIIDLCYNYKVEASVNNVCLHYDEKDLDSLIEDFLKRLSIYWSDYNKGSHVFHTSNSDKFNESIAAELKWSRAVRVVKNNIKRYNEKNCDNKEGRDSNIIYENKIAKERKRWGWLLGKSVCVSLKIAIFYLSVFVCVEFLMDGFADGFTDVLAEFQSRLLNIVIFGILASVVYSVAKIPDILDNLKSLALSVCDFKNLVCSKKYYAYSRLKKGKGKWF